MHLGLESFARNLYNEHATRGTGENKYVLWPDLNSGIRRHWRKVARDLMIEQKEQSDSWPEFK